MSMSPNEALSVKIVEEAKPASGSLRRLVSSFDGESVPVGGGCEDSRVRLLSILRKRHRPFFEKARGSLALWLPDELRREVAGLVRFVVEVGSEGSRGDTRSAGSFATPTVLWDSVSLVLLLEVAESESVGDAWDHRMLGKGMSIPMGVYNTGKRRPQVL